MDTSACWGVTCDEEAVRVALTGCTVNEKLTDPKSCRNMCKAVEGCDWTEGDNVGGEGNEEGQCVFKDLDTLKKLGMDTGFTDEEDQGNRCFTVEKREICLTTFDPNRGSLCIWIDTDAMNKDLKGDLGFDDDTGGSTGGIANCQPSGQCKKQNRRDCEREGCNWVEQTFDFDTMNMDSLDALNGGFCRARPVNHKNLIYSKWRSIWIRVVFCYRIPAPLVLVVPTKTRLESSTKKFNPHFMYD